MLLHHLYRDDGERVEEALAADDVPAVAQSADDLGFVPHADLSHLDPDLELLCQLLHELPEIDPVLGKKVEEQLGPAKEILGP